MIKTLSKDNLAFETAEGMILIDEIGTHLHPRWKMEVVNRLRKTFPKLQFIATTHEPLCLRGLGENEVIVLKKDNDDEIIAVSDLPNPNEYRVDQLLTSEYFGLNSVMDFETEDLFNEYYALISKDKLNSEEQKRVEELSEIIPKKKHLGDDIRDELVYYVIDQLLAKQVSDKGYKIVDDDIKQDAIEKVKRLWEHIAKNDTQL
jgi:predicted ATP-binding protein involved in virulence